MKVAKTFSWFIFLLIAFFGIAQVSVSEEKANLLAQEKLVDARCHRQLRDAERYGSRMEYQIVTNGCKRAIDKLRSMTR